MAGLNRDDRDARLSARQCGNRVSAVGPTERDGDLLILANAAIISAKRVNLGALHRRARDIGNAPAQRRFRRGGRRRPRENGRKRGHGLRRRDYAGYRGRFGLEDDAAFMLTRLQIAGDALRLPFGANDLKHG